MIEEKTVKPMSGWIALPCLFLMIALAILLILSLNIVYIVLGVVWLFLLLFVLPFGFLPVQPNDTRVLLLFGDYVGSVRTSGFYWVNPFYTKELISLRVRNFQTGEGVIAKVNDRDGNPIEISAVVAWKVVDTAKASFEVLDFEDFVEVQSDAALRNLASRHPYDSPDDSEVSLRRSTSEISSQLCEDIQERLEKAGVVVDEARISHLAYAQEIAAAMLQRQQAQAVVDARARIVEGAVGMVKSALDSLAADDMVELTEERKASMVANLLVVLCSHNSPQPVVNTGSQGT
ncbi:MAG: SPFH domain-containing protein [Gammaproteobacteria bacterium]|nr:SPFH domain-containing protein [Gammaproteobacteria bacterium]